MIILLLVRVYDQIDSIKSSEFEMFLKQKIKILQNFLKSNFAFQISTLFSTGRIILEFIIYIKQLLK